MGKMGEVEKWRDFEKRETGTKKGNWENGNCVGWKRLVKGEIIFGSSRNDS